MSGAPFGNSAIARRPGSDAPRPETQGMLRPTVERNIRQHRGDQPVAAFASPQGPHSRSLGREGRHTIG
jgi:hypothetical protein